MAAIDDKIDELTQADAERHAALLDEIKQLADAIAAQAPPDLTPQIAKLQTLVDAAKADTAALKADDPAAPTP